MQRAFLFLQIVRINEMYLSDKTLHCYLFTKIFSKGLFCLLSIYRAFFGRFGRIMQYIWRWTKTMIFSAKFFRWIINKIYFIFPFMYSRCLVLINWLKTLLCLLVVFAGFIPEYYITYLLLVRFLFAWHIASSLPNKHH